MNKKIKEVAVVTGKAAVVIGTVASAYQIGKRLENKMTEKGVNPEITQDICYSVGFAIGRTAKKLFLNK